MVSDYKHVVWSVAQRFKIRDPTHPTRTITNKATSTGDIDNRFCPQSGDSQHLPRQMAKPSTISVDKDNIKIEDWNDAHMTH